MIVRFASVSDVREFVGLATLQPYAIDVVDGEHVVSACVRRWQGRKLKFAPAWTASSPRQSTRWRTPL